MPSTVNVTSLETKKRETKPSSFGEAFGPLPSLSENLPLIEEMPLIEGMPLIEEPSGAYVLRGQRKGSTVKLIRAGFSRSMNGRATRGPSLQIKGAPLSSRLPCWKPNFA